MSASQIDSALLERKGKLKRSRDEVDPNNDESKKRGRPRLNAQDDESTADVSDRLLSYRRTRGQEQKEMGARRRGIWKKEVIIALLICYVTSSYHQHTDFHRNEGHRSAWLREPTDKERRILLVNSVTKSQNFNQPSSR
jgi:hypothetical protein